MYNNTHAHIHACLQQQKRDHWSKFIPYALGPPVDVAHTAYTCHWQHHKNTQPSPRGSLLAWVGNKAVVVVSGRATLQLYHPQLSVPGDETHVNDTQGVIETAYACC